MVWPDGASQRMRLLNRIRLEFGPRVGRDLALLRAFPQLSVPVPDQQSRDRCLFDYVEEYAQPPLIKVFVWNRMENEENGAIRVDREGSFYVGGVSKQFMTNPRVRNTPLEEQTEFLRAKGLTEAEIQSAMRSTEVALVQSARAQMPSTSSSPLSSLPPASRTSTGQSIVDLARSALVFGTAGYMVYRFVRSWMLPHLLNVPDPAEERMQRLEEQVGRLSESSRCIAESVTQTLAAVTEQNEQLSRTMMMVQGGGRAGVSDFDRLNAEIGIVKSLLLNQNQFPPVPETAFPRNRRAVQNGQNSNNTKGKIAASSLAKEENGEEAEEDGEEQRLNREVLSASTGSPV